MEINPEHIPGRALHLAGQVFMKVEADDVWDELQIQTNRGAAVVGAGLLERRIKKCLKARLIRRGKEADEVFGTDSKSGELTFAYQCKLAYSLGLVGEAGNRDLGRVGTIRNRFAHRMEVRDFDHPAVSEVVDQLESMKELQRIFEIYRPQLGEDFQNPGVGEISRRDKFIRTVSLLDGMISHVAGQFPTPQPKVLDCQLYW